MSRHTLVKGLFSVLANNPLPESSLLGRLLPWEFSDCRLLLNTESFSLSPRSSCCHLQSHDRSNTTNQGRAL